MLVSVGALLTLASAGYPLWRAWRALAATSLRHTLIWLAMPWAGWLAITVLRLAGLPDRPARYLPVCLSACAIVSVLGARRPGLGAWNFVTVGLLAVLQLPLLEQAWTIHWQLDAVWGLLLIVIMAIGTFNYVPTRLGVPTLIIGVTLSTEIVSLVQAPPESDSWSGLTTLLLGVGLWTAYFFGELESKQRPGFDALWRDFRNCYGFVWSWRVLEQFNGSAKHAGWQARLTWSGLNIGQGQPAASESEAMLETLRAILKRFAFL